MTTSTQLVPRPHDLADLYLAPLALSLDRKLQLVSSLTHDELDLHIALDTDRQPCDAATRASLALRSLVRLVPMHGWQAAWDPRGLRLQHEHHTFVLGVPDNVREYVGL